MKKITPGLKIKFWGVRGSIPSNKTPEKWVQHFEKMICKFLKSGHKENSDVHAFIKEVGLPRIGGFGTATTCVEVQSPEAQIIIDGGSGIRNFSEYVLTNKKIMGPFHIFMTHFHWDHVLGLPFFVPHFVPSAEIHYYSVCKDVEKLVRGIFQKPYFPVPYEALQSKITFHILEPRTAFQLKDMSITPYKLDHPDECWGYKISSGGKTYSHCVDTEATRVSRKDLGDDLPLYENVDLMYFDAQYTFHEITKDKANWGHGAAQIGLDIAFREGIKHVLFTHHDPSATVDKLLELKEEIATYYHNQIEHDHIDKIKNKVEWDFAHEGFEVEL